MHYPKNTIGRLILRTKSVWYFIAAIACFSWIYSCSGPSEEVPLEDVRIDLKVIRLDKQLYDASAGLRKQPDSSPEQLFAKYFKESREFILEWMYLEDDSLASDSLLGAIMADFSGDSLGQVLLDTLHFTFGNFDLHGALLNTMKRFHYYFPEKPIPTVVAFADGFPPTAQNGLDQVLISPNFLGIGLHYFMGPSFSYYPADLPKYIRRRCTPEHINAIVAHQIANVLVPKPRLENNLVLIDYIVQEGIKMALVDKLLGPSTSDTLKLFYEETQMDWANLYEGRIYKDLVGELYETDPILQRRYVEDSPFTSQLNRASAPRLGQFIGWKIVTSYLRNHPDVSLGALVRRTDYQQIFRDSKYKPPRES
jgi:hypothetical protein